MKSFAKLISLCGGALLCTLPVAVVLAEDAPDPDGWQKHEYRFSFMGFTSTYSCDGLADKLKLLLLTAGARKDAKSQPAACSSGFGRPDRFASAYLTFYTLAAPDPANQSSPVKGQWRAVKITQHSPSELGLGDCELIEQFRDHVLPMFSVRNMVNDVTCVPHQVSGTGYSLAFDSFAAVDPKAPPAKGT
jgi:hypothetical protein